MDNIEFLYNKYKNLQLDGSLEQFKNFLTTPDGAKKVYDKYGLAKDGSFEQFSNFIGLSSSKPLVSNPNNQLKPIGYDLNEVKDFIGMMETSGTNNYAAINQAGSSARGKYQIMWTKDHVPTITKRYGITTEEEWLNNPEIQEDYMDYLIKDVYNSRLPELKQYAIQRGKDYSDQELMWMLHHSWIANAKKYIDGDTTIPDYYGLDTRLKEARKQGWSIKRDLNSDMIIKNTNYEPFDARLPVRENIKEVTPTDSRLIDKLEGFMYDANLVVTGGSNGEHKSKEQKNGRSLDINFKDWSINPYEIWSAIQHGKDRGLRLVYETKDPGLYDKLLAQLPQLKDNLLDISGPGFEHTTGNHFSVYHDDSAPQQRADNAPKIEKELTGDRKYELNRLKHEVSKIKEDGGFYSYDKIPDQYGNIIYKKDAKSFKKSNSSNYRDLMTELLIEKGINISDLSDSDLAYLYGLTDEIASNKEHAQTLRDDLTNQFENKHKLGAIGDWFKDKLAGTLLDTTISRITSGGSNNIDVNDEGKINIGGLGAKGLFYDHFGVSDMYLTPDQIMELPASPLAKTEDPNDPANKELRRIQKILSAGDSLEFNAENKINGIRMDVSNKQIDKIQKELIKKNSQAEVDRYIELSTLSSNDQITDEQKEELFNLEAKLNNEGDLSKIGNIAKSYNESIEKLKALEGKYGLVQKYNLLKLLDEDLEDVRAKKTGIVEEGVRFLQNMASNLIEGTATMPGDVTQLLSLGVEAITGIDIGGEQRAKNLSFFKEHRVTSSKQSRDIFEKVMNIDGNIVIFDDDNNPIGAYDADGYSIKNETTKKELFNKAINKYKDDKDSLDLEINWSAGAFAAEEGIPKLLEMIFLGKAFIKSPSLISGALEATKNPKSLKSFFKKGVSGRTAESLTMVPVFTGDMIDQAVKNGAVTSEQIFTTAATELAREMLIERMFSGPVGKLLTSKGIDLNMASKNISKDIARAARRAATGEIAWKDLGTHALKSILEFGKDIGGEFIEEATASFTQGYTNQLLNSMLDTFYDENNSSWRQDINDGFAGLFTSMGMASPRLLIEAAGYKKGIEEAHKELRASVMGRLSDSKGKNAVVQSPSVVRDTLDSMVSRGEISQKNADNFHDAILKSVEDTKFLNEDEEISGNWISRRIKNYKNIESQNMKDTFDTYARNVAYDKNVLNIAESTNPADDIKNKSLIESKESILKGLQMNASKGIYSLTTPIDIAHQHRLNNSMLIELTNAQEEILDSSRKTREGKDIKDPVKIAKQYAVNMHIKGLEILKKHKEQHIKDEEQLLKDVTDIHNKIEELTKKSEEIHVTPRYIELTDKINDNTATTAEIEEYNKLQKGLIDSWYDIFSNATKKNLIEINEDSIQDLIDNYPNQQEYIIKKFTDLNVNNTKKQLENADQEVLNAPTDIYKRYKLPELVPHLELHLNKILEDVDNVIERLNARTYEIENELNSGNIIEGSPEHLALSDEYINIEDQLKKLNDQKQELDLILSSKLSVDTIDHIKNNNTLKVLHDMVKSVKKRGSTVTSGSLNQNTLQDEIIPELKYSELEVTDEDINQNTSTVEQTDIQSETVKVLDEEIFNNSNKSILEEASTNNILTSLYNIANKFFERQSNFVSRMKGKFTSSTDAMLSGAAVGNLIDVIARDVFAYNIGGKTAIDYVNEINNKATKKYEQDLAKYNEIIENNPKAVIEKPILRLVSLNESIFKELVKDMVKVRKDLERKGYVFISKDMIIEGMFNELGQKELLNRYVNEKGNISINGIAGALDLIAIDKTGNIHIIDFKNKKSRNPIDDQKDIIGGGKYTPKIKAWGEQQSVYAWLIERKLGRKIVSSINILPILTSYVVPRTGTTKTLSITKTEIPQGYRNNKLFGDNTSIIKLDTDTEIESKLSERIEENPNPASINIKSNIIQSHLTNLPLGEIESTSYEVKADGVYYNNTKLDNPNNKPYKQLIEDDIERRRQEDLKENVEPKEVLQVEIYEAENINSGEKQLVQIRTTKGGKKEIFVQGEGIQEGRSIWVSIGGNYSSDISNEVLLQFVENPKLVGTQNEQEFLQELKNTFKGSTAREKINAKYDAQIAALEGTTTSSSKGVQTPSDIEAQKADIERERKEELNTPLEDVKNAKTKEELIKASENWIGINPYDDGAVSMGVRSLLMTPGSFEKGKQSFIEENKRTSEIRDNQINDNHDAKYVDAARKGEMTKEQAMKALEEVGRKDSSAYAEIAALSKITQSQTPAPPLPTQGVQLELQLEDVVKPPVETTFTPKPEIKSGTPLEFGMFGIQGWYEAIALWKNSKIGDLVSLVVLERIDADNNPVTNIQGILLYDKDGNSIGLHELDDNDILKKELAKKQKEIDDKNEQIRKENEIIRNNNNDILNNNGNKGKLKKTKKLLPSVYNYLGIKKVIRDINKKNKVTMYSAYTVGLINGSNYNLTKGKILPSATINNRPSMFSAGFALVDKITGIDDEGEMTKEQALQALEKAGRKNNDAYAEIAALENTKSVSDKKADIERRRQEELLSFLPTGLKSLFNTVIKIIVDKDLKNTASYRKITRNKVLSEDIALSKSGNYRNLLHELIHKFIDGKFDTDTRLRFRSRVTSILNRISELSEGNSVVGRMLKAYTGVGYSIEEELVTWYLTDLEFRNEIDSLEGNIKDKIVSLIKEISGFTDTQIQELIDFDNSEKAQETAAENVDKINAKYDAEIDKINAEYDSTIRVVDMKLPDVVASLPYMYTISTSFEDKDQIMISSITEDNFEETMPINDFFKEYFKKLLKDEISRYNSILESQNTSSDSIRKLIEIKRTELETFFNALRSKWIEVLNRKSIKKDGTVGDFINKGKIIIVIGGTIMLLNTKKNSEIKVTDSKGVTTFPHLEKISSILENYVQGKTGLISGRDTYKDRSVHLNMEMYDNQIFVRRNPKSTDLSSNPNKTGVLEEYVYVGDNKRDTVIMNYKLNNNIPVNQELTNEQLMDVPMFLIKVDSDKFDEVYATYLEDLKKYMEAPENTMPKPKIPYKKLKKYELVSANQIFEVLKNARVNISSSELAIHKTEIINNDLITTLNAQEGLGNSGMTEDSPHKDKKYVPFVKYLASILEVPLVSSDFNTSDDSSIARGGLYTVGEITNNLENLKKDEIQTQEAENLDEPPTKSTNVETITEKLTPEEQQLLDSINNEDINNNSISTEIKDTSPDDSTDSSDIDDYGNTNFDFKITETLNTDYKGNSEEAKKYIKDRFQEIDVEIDDDVLEGFARISRETGLPVYKVWGAVHNNMVTLSSNSNKKVGKHEAMHVAERLFLNQEERKHLFKEMLSKWGKKLNITATKLEDLTEKELTLLREELADTFEEYKNTNLIEGNSNFAKKFPKITNFLNRLRRFIISNYYIGKSYLNNRKSIEQLFFEVENNTLGRNFLGNRKIKVLKDLKDNMGKNYPFDFKISTWSNIDVQKNANFIVKNLFTNYLLWKYKTNSLSSVLKANKYLNPTIIYKQFLSQLSGQIDNNIKSISKHLNGKNGDKYKLVINRLNDIRDYLVGDERNRQFEEIVYHAFKLRAQLGLTYDEFTKDVVIDVDDVNDSEDIIYDNDDGTNEDQEQNVDQRESWQIKAIDPITKSSTRLREYFSTLTISKLLDVKNTDGKIKPKRLPEMDLDFMIPKKYEGKYIHGLLLNYMSDTYDIEDFIQKINDLPNHFAFGHDILKDILNIQPKKIKVEKNGVIVETIQTVEEQILKHFYDGSLKIPSDIFSTTDPVLIEKYSKYNLWILKDMYSSIAGQTNNNPIRTTTSNSNGVEVVLNASVDRNVQKSVSKTLSSGILRLVDISEVDHRLHFVDKSLRDDIKNRVLKDRKEIFEKIDNVSSFIENFEIIPYDTEELNFQAALYRTGKDLQRIGELLGINFDSPFITHVLTDFNTIKGRSTTTLLSLALETIKEELNKKQTSIYPNEIEKRLTSISKKLNSFSELVALYNTDASDLSYLTVDMQNQFAHVNGNFLSKTAALWKKSKQKWADSRTKVRIINKDKSVKVLDIVFHHMLPFYVDLTTSYDYQIYPDGYTKNDDKIGSGKTYDKYTDLDMMVTSINAFLGSDNRNSYINNNKSTLLENSYGIHDPKDFFHDERNSSIKPHALFTLGVLSDAPQRRFMKAPVFSKKEIIERLRTTVYAEIERIAHINDSNLNTELVNITKNGKIIHTFPEINDVVITINGIDMPFLEVFTQKNIGNIKSTYPIKSNNDVIILKIPGKEVIPFKSEVNYTTLLDKIIETLMEDELNDFIKLLESMGQVRRLKNNTVLKTGNSQLGKYILKPIESPVNGLLTYLGANVVNMDKLEKYVYNSFYNNTVFQNVFNGDAVHYKANNKTESFTDIDIVKRVKQSIAPSIPKLFRKPKFSVVVLKDVELPSDFYTNEDGTPVESDITDAGAYHSLQRRQDIMETSPEWDLIKNEHLEIFNRLQNNTYEQEFGSKAPIKLKDDLKKIHLQILKPFFFDMVNRKFETKDGNTIVMTVPIQLKNSERVLLPNEAYSLNDGSNWRYERPTKLEDITEDKYKRPELAKILYMMETQNIDLVTFKSASKDENMESIKLLEIENDEELINLVSTRKWDLNNSMWGEQQNLPRKDLNSKIYGGSQEHKIMSTDIDENFEFTFKDTIYKGQEGINELLQKIQVENANINIDKIRSKFEITPGITDTLGIYNMLKEVFLENDMDIDMLEGFDIIPEDKKTLKPIELHGKKGMQKLNAPWKGAPRFKMNGAALANVPGLGYIKDSKKSKNRLSDDLKIVFTKDKDGNEVLDYFEAIVPVYDPIIYKYINADGSLKRSKYETPVLDLNGNPKLDADGNVIMERKPLIPEKLLNAFFYRIPTEGKYSMFPIKIVAFSMPAQGSGIVLPREATTMSGLDFDIDKVYGYYYNFKYDTPHEYLNKIKKIIGFENFDKNTKHFVESVISMLDNNSITVDPETFEVDKASSKVKFGKQKTDLIQNIAKARAEIIASDSISGALEPTIIEPGFDSVEAIANLKLDLYFAIAKTPRYLEAIRTPGNKDRLIKLRNEKVKDSNKKPKSYASPTANIGRAAKNMAGQRLIGIFANANAFNSLIQGVARIDLKDSFPIGGLNIYHIGDNIEQITKDISELLFASTEDVKDPVLEVLGINEATAGLLITLLSMSEKGTIVGNKYIPGRKISFEKAIEILNNPEIQKAAKKALRTGKRLSDTYMDNDYKDLIKISDEYNGIVSAAKLDAQIGPSFLEVDSKLQNLNNIEKRIYKKSYPFRAYSVRNILPFQNSDSKIKQLNTYRKALEAEIKILSEVYSFLTPQFKHSKKILNNIATGGKLAPKLYYKSLYYLLDEAVQKYIGRNYINSNGNSNMEYLLSNRGFGKDFFQTYSFPEGTEGLRSAFEYSSKKGLILRWIDNNSKNTIQEYKNQFELLFSKDPEKASELAMYAFAKGTNYSAESILKILPSRFFETQHGKEIRAIINGESWADNMSGDVRNVMNILFHKFKEIVPYMSKNDMLNIENSDNIPRFVWSSQDNPNPELRPIDSLYVFDADTNSYLEVPELNITHSNYYDTNNIINNDEDLDNITIYRIIYDHLYSIIENDDGYIIRNNNDVPETRSEGFTKYTKVIDDLTGLPNPVNKLPKNIEQKYSTEIFNILKDLGILEQIINQNGPKYKKLIEDFNIVGLVNGRTTQDVVNDLIINLFNSFVNVPLISKDQGMQNLKNALNC